MVVALLADPEGTALASRYLAALQSPTPFRQSAETLREWLTEGTSADTVVSLTEAAVAATPLAERVLRYRDGLPEPGPKSDRRSVSEALRAQRAQALSDLVPLFQEYGQSTREPAVLRAFVTVALGMYALSDTITSRAMVFPDLHQTVLEMLRAGLALDAPLRGAYLRLLAEKHRTLWNTADWTAGGKPHQEAARFQSWLHGCWSRNVDPVRALLGLCREADVVNRALDLGVARALATHEWRDPALFPFALMLSERFGVDTGDYLNRQLWAALDAFSTAREARACFQPVLQALQDREPWLRQHFLEALLSEVGHTRPAIRERLPRLAPYLRLLVDFAAADEGETCLCGTVIGGALALIEATSEQAGARLKWLLSFLETRMKGKGLNYEQIASLEIGLSIAVSLAPDNGDTFQAIVRTATSHHFRQDREQIERSLALLSRFPFLRAPLAHLFPQQPQRCADLLVRLGLTTRLNTDVRPLLARLEPQTVIDDRASAAFPVVLVPHADWWRVHRLTPEWTPTANVYLHAQWVQGESMALPSGARRALEAPRRMAQELAHLERVVDQQPDRVDLSSHAVKLRDRLADGEALTAEERLVVGERLAQVAAQAQVTAAERQVLACYRSRLEAIAGPLPNDLDFSADLINATLLTVDIAQNRRLLLRLIRAYLAGEHNWREQHPANQAFLAELADKGIDTDTWLSEYPRRYRCAAVPGRTVHLCLERDPLHILQMGNLFDTCLSFGGSNAFSTVANACELNKRVVYARDGFGRVIGRKLIGVNAEGDLIGFYTYASLTEEAGNDAVRAIVRQYVTRFAEICRLRLADTGAVTTLFAEAWYDDGLIAWDDEEQASTGKISRPTAKKSHLGQHSVKTPTPSGVHAGGH